MAVRSIGFVCLYRLSLCKIVRSSVILLLPLFSLRKTRTITEMNDNIHMDRTIIITGSIVYRIHLNVEVNRTHNCNSDKR